MTAQGVAFDYPPLYNKARAGAVFSAVTAATGVAPGTAIGTTAPFTLLNPFGSTVNLVILKASMAYVSGTLGSGNVELVVNTNPAAAIVTGTAITPVNHKLGGDAATGRAFTTATLPAAPTALRPFCTLAPILATSVVAPFKVEEDIDGAIIVTPGCAVSFESTAGAGTSPLVIFGMTWEEVSVDA